MLRTYRNFCERIKIFVADSQNIHTGDYRFAANGIINESCYRYTFRK